MKLLFIIIVTIIIIVIIIINFINMQANVGRILHRICYSNLE